MCYYIYTMILEVGVMKIVKLIDKFVMHLCCIKHEYEGTCKNCRYASKCDKVIYTDNKEHDKYEL